MKQLILLSAAILLAACGPTEFVCGPDTCNGCCDSSGVCQGGNQDTACGTAGASCDACPSSLQQCVAGDCVDRAATGGGAGGGAAGGTAGGSAGGSAGGAAGGTAGGAAGGTAGGGMQCTPETDAAFCARRSTACGSQSGLDNCNTFRSVPSCGTCMAGRTCSGGACICQPETNAQFCARQTTTCGALSGTDNCGASRSVSCGTCTTPNTCTAGQCTCTSETDAQFCARRGTSCGTATGNDNCLRPRTVTSCGTCTGVNQCIGGSCSCPAETNTQFCVRLGAACGALSGTDSCGNTRNVSSCGSCTGVNTCAGAGTPNACGCTPQTDAELCAATSTSCGSITTTDRCGMARTVSSCGSCASGTRCPATTPSNRACQPFTCSSGQRACGQTCATCPTTGVASTACGANDTCVAATCATDFELVNGACQPATCPANQRSCGGSCRTCPTSGVVSTTCSGPACIAASCVDGSGVSGGQCVPMTCGTGQLFCSTACATCPTTGAASFGCDSTVCSARSCAAGYSLNGRICVDSDWSFDPLDAAATRASTSVRSASVAIGPGGSVYVAYSSTTGDLVVARRLGAANWSKVRVPSQGGYSVAVTNLVIDASGNAHVITYYLGGNYPRSYLKVSPAGTTSMPLFLGYSYSYGEIVGDQVGLAVDSNGDAHLAYDVYVNGNIRTKYRRSFQGSWLAPIEASTTGAGSPSIFVEGGGDIVHIAGGTSYTRGVSSIFSAPVAVPSTYFQETQLFLNGSTLELWGRDGTTWAWTALSTATIAAPVTWTPGTSTYSAGARGPGGFSVLEQSSSANSAVTARSGPVTGPTLTEVTNLPLYRVQPGAAMDANGALHALAWSGSSSGLTYVRGH